MTALTSVMAKTLVMVDAVSGNWFDVSLSVADPVCNVGMNITTTECGEQLVPYVASLVSVFAHYGMALLTEVLMGIAVAYVS